MVVVLAWFGAVASADCAELVDALGADPSRTAAAELARTEAWNPQDLDCLVEAGVPRNVVLNAARSAGLPPPEELRPRWELGAVVGYVPTRKVTPGDMVGGHLAYWPVRRVGVALTGAARLDLGNADYKDVDAVRIDWPLDEVPELREHAALTVQLAPLVGALGAGRRSAEVRGVVLAGVGVARTADPYWSSSPPYCAFECFLPDRVSTHPTLTYGAALVVAPSGPVGLRLQVDQARWVERFVTTPVALQRTQVAAALTWQP